MIAYYQGLLLIEEACLRRQQIWEHLTSACVNSCFNYMIVKVLNMIEPLIVGTGLSHVIKLLQQTLLEQILLRFLKIGKFTGSVS